MLGLDLSQSPLGRCFSSRAPSFPEGRDINLFPRPLYPLLRGSELPRLVGQLVRPYALRYQQFEPANISLGLRCMLNRHSSIFQLFAPDHPEPISVISGITRSPVTSHVLQIFPGCDTIYLLME